MNGPFLLFLDILIIAIGQVCFKFAAKTIELKNGNVFSMFLNPLVLFSFGLYGLGSVIWILVLKKYPLSIAYPILSITYVIVTFASAYFFQEQITANKIIGLGCILLGIFFIARAV